MAAHAKCIEIAAEDRPVLERLVNSRTAERRLVERAQIVLLAAEGRPASEIAERVGCVAETARRQRARFERRGSTGCMTGRSPDARSPTTSVSAPG